ncbi:MAG: DnaB-like helicase N-terminal domain-containing protein [Hyphomonas sp.]
MPLDDTHSPSASIAPPHNLSAEAAVLGAILFDNNAYQRIADILRHTDFYAPAHQELFEVASMMIQQGRIADGVTLREHFEKAEKLTEIGGALSRTAPRLRRLWPGSG